MQIGYYLKFLFDYSTADVLCINVHHVESVFVKY